MQLELGLVLRGHRHHAGVVRPRAHLGEPDLVALDEQLDAEDAEAAEVVGDAWAISRERCSAAALIGVRLPALDVVAADLHVADRLAEMRTVPSARARAR
jgi:hypothetical protein